MTIDDKYTGKCIGGPHDGKMLDHYAPRKNYTFFGGKRGYYEWFDGVWKWAEEQ